MFYIVTDAPRRFIENYRLTKLLCILYAVVNVRYDDEEVNKYVFIAFLLCIILYKKVIIKFYYPLLR